MFRGGDYYDDPKFYNQVYQAKNSLDVTVINTINIACIYLFWIGYNWSLTKNISI
jgi:hypothetical protein